MKEKLHILKHFLPFFALMFLLAILPVIQAEAAEYSASVTTDRTTGECSYSVHGLDITANNTLTLQVSQKDTGRIALQKDIALTPANCTGGTYTDRFSLASLNNIYAQYQVTLLTGGTSIPAGICDFSIHTDKLSIQMDGNTGNAARTITVTQAEPLTDVAIPGKNNSVSVLAWPAGSDETTAKTSAAKAPFTGNGMVLTADMTNAGTSYGSWNAKLVLEPDASAGNTTQQTLATTAFTVEPTHTSITVQKTKALEKKKAFGVTVNGLKNAYGIKKASFQISNSKGKTVASINGTKKTTSGSKFYAEVSLKKLGYLLDDYTIQVIITDNNGNTRQMNGSTSVSEKVHGGTLSVTKKGNATCFYKLSKAYIPGNIKKARFVIYQMNGKKMKKQGAYTVKNTSGKDKITLNVHNEATGKFKVKVYGYTAWGKKIFLNEETYKLRKKDMGKNGWYYEKYAGKTYKFYYVNNKKQTDLTKMFDFKKSSSTNTNRFYIEVNRAASNVTIFVYNEETKKYDIPIKTCAVCVGSDTWTNLGTSGLKEESSYTPLGNYSICTNGTSVKYTLKPMHEPDGSIVYARWASHIVGNVYFHAIAVSTQSHYALPASRYNRLGSPASAGCIRMTVADAKWIYDYCSTGTPVKILKGNSSKPGPLGKGSVIKVTGGINYDPTDPGVPDSRKKADYKAKRISGYQTRSGKKVGF